MAAIGPGWATDAWVEASWVSGAWGAAVAVVRKFYNPMMKTLGRMMNR